MEVIHLTKENFKKAISDRKGLAFVDFWADWCGPCKMFSPLFEKAANECTEDAVFFKVNIDEAAEIADEYKVLSIPTVVLFKDGEEINRSVGVVSKDKILEMIK